MSSTGVLIFRSPSGPEMFGSRREMIPSNCSLKKAGHVLCFEMCRSEGEHDQEQERPFSELRAKELFQ